MGFFGKLKNLAGIGGVKISIDTPNAISKEEGMLKGKVVATTKSDQHLLDLELKLEQRVTSGRGDNKEEEVNTIGSIKLDLNKDITTGENMEIDFEVPFQDGGNTMGDLAKKGGALGGLGKMAKFASNETVEYYIVADLDVKNVALDPSEEKKIILN